MNEYVFKVSLCDGYFCKGEIKVSAENEDAAEDMALSYIGSRLYEALPELDIDISVHLV